MQKRRREIQSAPKLLHHSDLKDNNKFNVKRRAFHPSRCKNIRIMFPTDFASNRNGSARNIMLSKKVNKTPKRCFNNKFLSKEFMEKQRIQMNRNIIKEGVELYNVTFGNQQFAELTNK